MESEQRDYDIAVTFAGEDREFVQAVVEGVKAAGFSVFYDEDNPADLWGEELTEYFPSVYESRARYAVMFVSKFYAAKPWTRLERRSVLLRAMEQSSTYLLPVRLDSTPLPGLRTTIGFLDGLRLGPEGVIDQIKIKLGDPKSSGARRFNGLVPRTQAELAIVLGERPAAWAYLAFAYFLVENVEQHASEYNDHVLGFVLPGDFLPNSEVLPFTTQQVAKIRHLMSAFEQLLFGPAQGEATGDEEHEPDPEKIERLAARIGDIYVEMLRWQSRVRAQATESDTARDYLRAFARYADQPIETMHDFAALYRTEIDTVTARIADGEKIELSLTIRFDIPDDVTDELDVARVEFAREELGVEL